MNPGRDDEAVRDRDFKPVRPGRSGGVTAFTIFGQQGVEINDVLDAAGDAVSHAGDDHAAITVSDEHDIVQVFPEDDVDYVLNVRVEINVGAVEIGMFAQAGKRRAIDGVSISGKQMIHRLPIPSATPCAMHDDKG